MRPLAFLAAALAVAAPAVASPAHAQTDPTGQPGATSGPGWRFELAPGWRLVPGHRPGDLIARKAG